jgi:phosphatidylinositol alpha-1,6-mannosyltransferase
VTPDVGFIWAGNLKPGGYVARWLHARRKLPYGLMVHGLDVALIRSQARSSHRKRRWARAIIAAAAGTVANSRYTCERFQQLALDLDLPRAAERVRVIPLGADAERFHPDGAPLALGPGHWLLTVARLVPHKGIDTALTALAILAAEQPDLRYAVAGEGSDRDRLMALTVALGIADRVRFLGVVSEADLPALYRAADLYLGLSREEGPEVEGFGLSLAEAQASGLPVVAGRSGGIPDAVEAGVSALLVSPTDGPAVAETVRALLGDPARMRALGAAGRELVERRLNWGRVTADLAAAQEEFARSSGDGERRVVHAGASGPES